MEGIGQTFSLRFATSEDQPSWSFCYDCETRSLSWEVEIPAPESDGGPRRVQFPISPSDADTLIAWLLERRRAQREGANT